MEDVTFDKHKDTAYTWNISYKITPEVVEEGDTDMDTWNLYLQIQFKKKYQCYDLMVEDSLLIIVVIT